MSFGFPTDQKAIGSAIRKAHAERDGSILFFAAAANEGGNEREMFPANHELVISVRGTTTEGVFADFNPPRPQDEASVYGTLGREVSSAWLRGHPEMRKTGTSVATPIAAGLAAMILGDVDGRRDSNEAAKVRENLRSRRGMLAMFKRMSRDMGNGCLYLAPWGSFDKGDDARWAMIRDAISG